MTEWRENRGKIMSLSDVLMEVGTWQNGGTIEVGVIPLLNFIIIGVIPLLNFIIIGVIPLLNFIIIGVIPLLNFIIIGVIPLLIPPDVDEINTTVVGAEDFNHPVTPSNAMRGTDPSSIGFSFTLCEDKSVIRYGMIFFLQRAKICLFQKFE
jgi:hypothetical protein